MVWQRKEKGCRIFSYSDPLAALSLAGPVLAKEIAKEWLSPFLKQWLALPGSGILHLCGRSSFAPGCSRLCRDGRNSFTYVLWLSTRGSVLG